MLTDAEKYKSVKDYVLVVRHLVEEAMENDCQFDIRGNGYNAHEAFGAVDAIYAHIVALDEES